MAWEERKAKQKVHQMRDGASAIFAIQATPFLKLLYIGIPQQILLKIRSYFFNKKIVNPQCCTILPFSISMDSKG
jgi:hypothetical protein